MLEGLLVILVNNESWICILLGVGIVGIGYWYFSFFFVFCNRKNEFVRSKGDVNFSIGII